MRFSLTNRTPPPCVYKIVRVVLNNKACVYKIVRVVLNNKGYGSVKAPSC